MHKVSGVVMSSFINDVRAYLKRNSHLRFGQAVFNWMPKEWGEHLLLVDKDFFYELDEIKVLQTLWEEFVE